MGLRKGVSRRGILLAFKLAGFSVDAPFMGDAWLGWLSVAVVGAFGILAMLNLLASFVRNEQVVFNLRCDVERLQMEYTKRMREMRELEAAGLKVIEVGKPPPGSASAGTSAGKKSHH